MPIVKCVYGCACSPRDGALMDAMIQCIYNSFIYKEGDCAAKTPGDGESAQMLRVF